MKKLILHGILKKLACGELNIKAGSLQDIIKCINVNFPKFASKIKKFNSTVDGIVVIIDGELCDNVDVDKKIQTATTIELVPTLVFSALISATAFATITSSVAAAKALAFIANVLIISVISFGISFLVAKLLTPKDPKQVKTSSFILGAKSNIAARNTPIPLGYGKLRVGSYIISSFGLNLDSKPTNAGLSDAPGAGFVGLGWGGYGSGGNIIITRPEP